MFTSAPIAKTAASAPLRRANRAILAALATLFLGLASPPLALLCVALAAAAALFTNQGAALSLRLDELAAPALAAAAVGAVWGLDGAMGVVLLWRIVADARWSRAQAALLARASDAGAERGPAGLAVWTTPAVALAAAAYTAPHILLGLPLDLPHVPLAVPLAAGALAALALFDWGVQKLAEWRLGTLAPAAAAHLIAHHAIFLAAYVVSPDLSAGVMAMLVWRLAHAATARA